LKRLSILLLSSLLIKTFLVDLFVGNLILGLTIRVLFTDNLDSVFGGFACSDNLEGSGMSISSNISSISEAFNIEDLLVVLQVLADIESDLEVFTVLEILETLVDAINFAAFAFSAAISTALALFR
jgi:hypothetical protein